MGSEYSAELHQFRYKRDARLKASQPTQPLPDRVAKCGTCNSVIYIPQGGDDWIHGGIGGFSGHRPDPMYRISEEP